MGKEHTRQSGIPDRGTELREGIRNSAEETSYESNQNYCFIDSFIVRKLGCSAERRRRRGGDRSRRGCWNRRGCDGTNTGNVESCGNSVDARNPTGNDFDSEFSGHDAVHGAGLEFDKPANARQYNEAIDNAAEYDSGNVAERVALRIAAGYTGRAERIGH